MRRSSDTGKRGLVTLQLSGDDPAQVRQVAAEALRIFWAVKDEGSGC